MADAHADNQAELNPEDAPSEVQLFDEHSDGEGSPPRGRGGGNRNRPRDRSPENDTTLQPEDAPSEVQLFDEDPEERDPRPRRQGAGGRNSPGRGTRDRAHSTPRREPRRAQNLPRREPHGRAQNPQDSGERARTRPETARERRDERRWINDAPGQAQRRRPLARDELQPNTRQAQRFWDVEDIRRRIYRIRKEQAGEPIENNRYRWYVQGYVRERHSGRDKRQIIVEGGPERIDVLFDEDTPNKKIDTWIAKKILEQKGLGPRAPRPSEMRERTYDKNICCPIL